jgi:hypothetical protein
MESMCTAVLIAIAALSAGAAITLIVREQHHDRRIREHRALAVLSTEFPAPERSVIPTCPTGVMSPEGRERP